jgi:hypothetical protein
MTHLSYTYNVQDAHRYIFASIGKTRIIKAVDFTPTTIPNLYSLSFGDLQSDGTVDDISISNNGDILKVLSTVVQIAMDFLNYNPHFKLVFTGSTDERTRLYARILKMYESEFRKSFTISALIATEHFYKEIDFNPQDAFKYSAFFLKKK